MDDRSALVRDLSLPLASGKGWVKFVGIINNIVGALYAISIFGLIIAWVPIWMGVLLVQSGNAIERAQMAGDESALRLALDKLRVYFIIQGVLFIISLAVMVLGFVVFFGALMAAFAGHNTYGM